MIDHVHSLPVTLDDRFLTAIFGHFFVIIEKYRKSLHIIAKTSKC